MRHVQALLLGTILLLAGCGGGGSSSAIVNPEAEVSAGKMRVAGQFKSPEITSLATGLSAYAFSGNITKAYLSNTTPSRNEGEIVFYRESLANGREIVAFDPDGTSLRIIVGVTAAVGELAVSPDGAWLYFVEANVLKRVPMAGGTVSTILSDVSTFALTPSGTRVVVSRPAADDVSIVGVDGTGLSVRLNPADADGPRVIGCLNEDTAVVCNKYLFTSPVVLTVTLSGAVSASQRVIFVSSSISHMELHPARDRIVARYHSTSNGNGYLQEFFPLINGNTSYVLRNDLLGDTSVGKFCFSPDGEVSVAFRQASGEDAVVILDRYHNVLSYILRPAVVATRPVWAPAPTFRTLIGSGNYASGAAALLMTDVNSRTPAVVLADATTRASMVVKRISDSNDGGLIYDLTCDNMTKLHYTKANAFTQIGVIGALTGVKGAIVSFDIFTGKVGHILTYSKKPTVSRMAGKWVAEGDGIIEHFDGSGTRKPVSTRIALQ